VKELVKIGGEKWIAIDLAFIRFLIDVLCKDYDFDMDIHDKLLEETLDLETLAYNIYKSVGE
jgi:hypothetical protein